MKFKKKMGGKKGKVLTEIEGITKLYEEIPDGKEIESFKELPLSQKTKKGLMACKFSKPTEIQRECIGLALRGGDILGAAKTGSGKTLAFVVPILECLWRNQWTTLDGLGAIIISPTRELAYQIFQVLRNVGQKHDFSAALLIGGTDLEYEKKRLGYINIVVCTPGRLLQHMDENPEFSTNNMKMLVIDEADRILDMGFSNQMNNIIENLQCERQTLLFSATQTNSVKDLARLSLVEPAYISVHQHATNSTPDELIQSYVICMDHEKLDMLWSFLCNHLKKKILVFMSSCRQVRYVIESFRQLKPGIPLLALHGGLNQTKRMAAYNQFCTTKCAALIATDVAARGLDFPSVDWVLQIDCPADAQEYIHRSGRTARLNAKGEALLVLTPSQSNAMVEKLVGHKIPVTKIEINMEKMKPIAVKLAQVCAADPKLKSFAQSYFLAYYRSIFCMRDKQVFDVNSIDGDALATSLGLPFAPRVKFMKHQNAAKSSESVKTEEASDTSDKCNESFKVEPIRKKMKRESTSEKEENVRFSAFVDEEEDGELFEVAKHQKHEHIIIEDTELVSTTRAKNITRIALAKKLLKTMKNKKTRFDDQGQIQEEIEEIVESNFDMKEAKQRMKEADKTDRIKYNDKRKLKKLEKKKKKRKIADSESEMSDNNGEIEVTLGNYGSEDNLEDQPLIQPTSQNSSKKEMQHEIIAKQLLGIK